MAPNGGWTNSGARTGMENRNSRIPGAARVSKPNPTGSHDNHFRRTMDNRGNDVHSARTRQGIESINQPFQLPQREGGLPQKPPLSTYQTWGGNQFNRAGKDRAHQNRFSGRPEGSVDSYVPSYSGTSDRVWERDGDSLSPSTNHRHPRSEQTSRRDRDNYRDYNSRRRSRSPDLWKGDRATDGGPYRR